MSEELYRKYRPTKLTELYGQEKAANMLREMGRTKRMPHVLLLTGESGVGKTTTARILRKLLKCGDEDYMEVNVAVDRGIDVFRRIEERQQLAPVSGKTRIWTLDEVHCCTPQAFSSTLKLLEDVPEHVYFFLCTTHPGKLLPAIRTRATEVQFRSLSGAEVTALVQHVSEQESIELADGVCEAIVTAAEGSARKALVMLQQAAACDGKEAQIEATVAGVSKAIDLARALIQKKSWKQIAALLKSLDDSEETTRRTILGYCNSVMLGGGKQAARAFVLADEFRDHFFDSGRAGLTMACWEVTHG